MSKETAHTGGNFKFEYTDEDNERIRNSDTESTIEFRKALEQRRERKAKIVRVLNKIKASMLVLLIIILLIIVIKFLITF